ncbi:hypothetical protein BJI47_02200 [Rhodococcus sp. 1168]|nr:hypothetical protein BJI47_02200 [Rhodococcus sp. 1168]
MKSYQLSEYTGPQALSIHESEEVTGSAGDVIIEVHAIGINFPDLLITKGQYQNKPELPFIPGSEVAGIVRSCPPSSSLQPGDRVAAFLWKGGYSETVCAPVHAVFRLPEDMDFAVGAATIINYHTVYFALVRRGRIEPGETLLVMGAAGGIGTAAVQVGAALGAKVIAGVANDEQAAVAQSAGADSVLILDKGFSTKVRSLNNGRGVDVVLDPLGDWLFGEALRTMAPEGRILVTGFAAGQIPQLGINRLLLKNISAVGVAWGAFLDTDEKLMETANTALSAMYERREIAPAIKEIFTFEQIPQALTMLDNGQISGKAVVIVRP